MLHRCAYFNPEKYAAQALGDGVRRSGSIADKIAAMLTGSQADDQGMFTVADAMGNSGQRMLSTVARNPNDMRQTVVDTLTLRQMGQGERWAQSSLPMGLMPQIQLLNVLQA